VNKINKFFGAIDRWFNRFIAKGEKKAAFGYFVKYLLLSGMLINGAIGIAILISIFL
jgi:hypothetical protein